MGNSQTSKQFSSTLSTTSNTTSSTSATSTTSTSSSTKSISTPKLSKRDRPPAKMFHPHNGREDFASVQPSRQLLDLLQTDTAMTITPILLQAMVDRSNELRAQCEGDVYRSVATDFGFANCEEVAQLIQDASASL